MGAGGERGGDGVPEAVREWDVGRDVESGAAGGRRSARGKERARKWVWRRGLGCGAGQGPVNKSS